MGDEPREPGGAGSVPGAVPQAGTPGSSGTLRLFGSPSFLRLWIAQVLSSLGDWVGTIAIIPLSDRLGGSFGTGITLAARFVPGFFLAPLAGVLVDRLDRKKVMVACDVGRALVLASLPWVGSLWMLVFVSFLLECLTLLWSPAKDASVPNLVRPEQLATAGSLGMAAAYGTFPLAAGLSAVLFKVAEWLSNIGWLNVVRVNRESVLIYFDVLTFLASAALITTIQLNHRRERAAAVEGDTDLARAFHEIREGWRFIKGNTVVRAVMIGLGTGLMGGGLVIPLGKKFTDEVLGAGDAGYSLMLFAMGIGASIGILAVVVLQRRLPREFMFCACVLGGGIALLLAASMSGLGATLWSVGFFGVSAGAGFVLGNTILQADVEDALRGRVFAAFYALIRMSLILPLLAGPFASGGFDRLSRAVFGDDRGIVFAGAFFYLPGVRLTLWAGSVIILSAAFLAFYSLGREHHPRRHAVSPT